MRFTRKRSRRLRRPVSRAQSPISRRDIRRFSRSFDREMAALLSPVPFLGRPSRRQAWAFGLLFTLALGSVFASTALAAAWFSPIVAGAVPTLTIASAALGALVARLRRDHQLHVRDLRRPGGYAKATDETTDL